MSRSSHPSTAALEPPTTQKPEPEPKPVEIPRPESKAEPEAGVNSKAEYILRPSIVSIHGWNIKRAPSVVRPAIVSAGHSLEGATMDLGQNKAEDKQPIQLEASDSNSSELSRVRAENELLKIRVESLESSQTALKQYCSGTELLRQRVDVLEVKEIALKKQAAENDSLRDKVKELESLLQSVRNDLSDREKELQGAKTISVANKSELERCRSDMQMARKAAAEFETEREIWEDRVVESEMQTEKANKSRKECKKHLKELETQMEGFANELKEAQEAKRKYEEIARSYRVKLQSLLGGNNWSSTYVYQ